MAKTSRASVQQMLRMPDDLRERVRLSAERNGRSINAEIVEVLEQAFPSPRLSDAEIDSMLADLREEMKRRPEAEWDELRTRWWELLTLKYYEPVKDEEAEEQ